MSKIREKDEEDSRNISELRNDKEIKISRNAGLFVHIVEKIKNIPIHMYKEVPACPECGSLCTGRYVKEPMSEKDKDYMERETLKYGEIVRFIPKIPYKNLFCVDCDYKWHGDVNTRWVNGKQLEQIVEERGTYEAYVEVLDEQSFKNKGSWLKDLLG